MYIFKEEVEEYIHPFTPEWLEDGFYDMMRIKETSICGVLKKTKIYNRQVDMSSFRRQAIIGYNG